MKKYILFLAAAFMSVTFLACARVELKQESYITNGVKIEFKIPVNTTVIAYEEPTNIDYVEEIPEQPVYIQNDISETKMSEEDIELIALLTMAEAEGECEEGKRLVIDTILNRMDSEYFPDTAYDVIYQPYHFSSMWNGRAERCEVREDICQLVREELECRYNSEVIFFNAYDYSDYGVPMFQVGNHYFSSYN